MGKPLVFIPGKKFPSVSITGSRCWLNCSYCMGHYLKIMDHVETPKQLYDLARYYWRRGAYGLMVSGGFTRDGRLPVESFLPIIRDIRRDFGLIINIHVGLVDRGMAGALRDVGVDIVDYELVMDDLVIRNIKHLDKTVNDYIRGYEYLLYYGPDYIAPHIPIGLKYGVIDWEYSVIDFLRDYDPYLTVFLVFIPTRNTPMENIEPPKPHDVYRVIGYGRRMLGGELSMGCMRPWSIRFILDRMLISNGVIDRIVNPPRQVIRDYRLRVIETCCSIPRSMIYSLGIL